MRRRHLINLAALGVAGAVSFAALESVRHDVHAAVSGDAFVDLDEWERIAWEYGYTYSVTPTKTLLDELAVDLLVVRRQLDQTTGEATRRDLQRVIARLSAFVAMCWADLGNLRAEHRWWRTARTAADASRDPEIQTWVRGREAIQGLYQPGPLSRIIDHADETLALTASAGLGVGSLSARAQAQAKLGLADEAERSLALLREDFAKVPAHIANDVTTMYGWSEHRLLHTESYVYTYLGDSKRAGDAQDRVLALYPAHRYLARTQVQLHQAMCLVNSGDVTEGVNHAQQVVAALPAAHRPDDVLTLARSVADAVPYADRHRPAVTTLRELAAIPSAAPA